MTHYKRDTVAQLNREIEQGVINPQVGDTLEALAFGTEGDGGGATYKVMPEPEVVDCGDILLPNGNIFTLPPYKQPKKKKRKGGGKR